ncbi:MAG: Cysteine desulfurase [Firmicutes bacterium ADurb.Bin182]|nr:MAG: Cysteine desulfurase [Firmicutes bacterium ADurb.Bin182]
MNTDGHIIPCGAAHPFDELIQKAFASLSNEFFRDFATEKSQPADSAQGRSFVDSSEAFFKTHGCHALEPLSGRRAFRIGPLDRCLSDTNAIPRLTQKPVSTGFGHSGFGSVRSDFPILLEKINGKPLIYLDNAATTQKPVCVIERIKYFYEHENSNIHRGAHTLAARAENAYEGARKKAAEFLNAKDPLEIIFVRGTTEAINLAAYSYGEQRIFEGDEILISALEHHSNIVPWQMICEKTGAKLKVFPVDDSGQVMFDEYERMLSEKVKLVAFTHVSNATGVITPAKELTKAAHKYGAAVLIDGAQAAAHMKVDVRDLDCEFYAFSGHKVFGPTGIGVLYAKTDIMKKMRPYQGGGGMITDVAIEKTAYRSPPYLFEAGTAGIAGAAGLGAALEYVSGLGREAIFVYEHRLLGYACSKLLSIPGLKIVGGTGSRAGVLSFVVKDHCPEEIGRALDKEGIAIRAGHHCAQPVLRRFGLESTVRLSLAVYNTFEEIDRFIFALERIIRSF